MPNTIIGKVNHHFFTFNAREEGYLTVGLRHNATVLTAFIIELHRGLAHGNGLRCGRHNDQRGVLYFYRRCCGERSDAVRLSHGGNLRDVHLSFCTHGSSAKDVTLDGECGRTINGDLVQ